MKYKTYDDAANLFGNIRSFDGNQLSQKGIGIGLSSCK